MLCYFGSVQFLNGDYNQAVATLQRVIVSSFFIQSITFNVKFNITVCHCNVGDGCWLYSFSFLLGSHSVDNSCASMETHEILVHFTLPFRSEAGKISMI